MYPSASFSPNNSFFIGAKKCSDKNPLAFLNTSPIPDINSSHALSAFPVTIPLKTLAKAFILFAAPAATLLTPRYCDESIVARVSSSLSSLSFFKNSSFDVVPSDLATLASEVLLCIVFPKNIEEVPLDDGSSKLFLDTT